MRSTVIWVVPGAAQVVLVGQHVMLSRGDLLERRFGLVEDFRVALILTETVAQV